MRIVVFGDIHMQTVRLAEVDGLREADLVLVTGDLTHFGGSSEAQKVLEAITSFNPHVLAIHGNLDRPGVAALLQKRFMSLHGTAKVTEGLGLMGVGGSNPTPFHTPCEYPEEEIEFLLKQGLKALDGHRPFLLLSHPPPARTSVDRLGSGSHVGSMAVRDFIERHGPAFCLCGHIHEARGIEKIGNTVIVNTGTLQEGGWLELTYMGERFTYTLHSHA